MTDAIERPWLHGRFLAANRWVSDTTLFGRPYCWLQDAQGRLRLVRDFDRWPK